MTEIAALEAFDEFGFIEIVVDLAIDEVLELVGAREVVDRITRCSPRSLSAFTMLLPINPAAPVTMMVMVISGEKFVVVDGGGTQFSDHDSGRAVRVSDRVDERHTRAQHGCDGRDHGVAGTRNIIHFACIG